jgi:hypothetical protein
MRHRAGLFGFDREGQQNASEFFSAAHLIEPAWAVSDAACLGRVDFAGCGCRPQAVQRRMSFMRAAGSQALRFSAAQKDSRTGG